MSDWRSVIRDRHGPTYNPTSHPEYDQSGRHPSRAAGKTSLVANDKAYAVKWLSDDTASGKRTTVDVRLPGPSIDDQFATSPDSRTIYYGAARAEADIWIVERK